jgi:hypothetical protein
MNYRTGTFYIYLGLHGNAFLDIYNFLSDNYHFFRTLPLKPWYPVRGRGCRMRVEDDAGNKGYPYSVFWQD